MRSTGYKKLVNRCPDELEAPVDLISWRLAAITALVLIVLLGWWHGRGLGGGDFSHYDEYYTVDRSAGFAAQGDWWAVYALGEPTLKKPPLQYWMSGGLLRIGVSELVALRLPSLVFGIGALIATAVLAAVMVPRWPWVMPTSVALLSTSDFFWRHATAAMLDAGASFFATLGVLAIVLTLKDLRYWPAFPIAAFLAGLQKAPTPLGFLLFALLGLAATTHFQSAPVRDVLFDRRFRMAVVMGLLAGFAWQVLQELRFLGHPLNGSVEKEMLNRFEPSLEAFAEAGFEAFNRLILTNEPTVRLAGFAGLLLLPFATKMPRLHAATGIAAFFVLSMQAASGSVYPRYTLTVLPLLCVGAGVLPFLLLRRFLPAAAVAVALIALVGGPFRPFAVLAQSRGGEYGAPMEDILAPLAATFRADETLMLCQEGRRIPPGAVSVFAPKAVRGFPIFLSDDESGLRRTLGGARYDGGPVRGICDAGRFEAIAPYFVDAETSPLPGGFLMWSASGFRFELG